MKTILAVHQGTEKYGSDKSFISACSALNRDAEKSVSILLPERGPICDLIRDEGLAPARTRHLWVLRKADIWKAVTVGLPQNMVSVFRAVRDLKTSDVTYINTAVILDFLLASILTRQRLIVHVREIPNGAAMKVIRRLLLLSRARIIFNSQATSDAFNLPKKQAQSVVYNGFDRPRPFDKARYGPERKLEVLCIGRLNAWKGQEVLVEACALLGEAERRRISVKIVGGVYNGQDHFRTNIEKLISDRHLANTVQLLPFADDPSELYRSADVVVVPSTLPEPFGRVAIEAMAYRNAVVATNHGGLKEIVVHGETGRLIPPSNPSVLAEVLASYIDDPDMLARHQLEAEARFGQLFTQEASDAALIDAFNILQRS